MADSGKTAELSSGPDGDVDLPDVAAFLKNNPGWELETVTFRFTGPDADSGGSEYTPEDNTLITGGEGSR